jgi:hypothetical protein
MLGERSFIILRYVNKVPTIGGCTKCPCKFFAPTIYKRDVLGAEHYLQSKFNEHRCAEEVKGPGGAAEGTRRLATMRDWRHVQ